MLSPELLSGFNRRHVLHHAKRHPVRTPWMIKEQGNGQKRTPCAATGLDREALQEGKERLRELTREVAREAGDER